jgi:hypothetical protein
MSQVLVPPAPGGPSSRHSNSLNQSLRGFLNFFVLAAGPFQIFLSRSARVATSLKRVQGRWLVTIEACARARVSYLATSLV